MGIPFDEKELEVVETLPATAMEPVFDVFSYPIPEVEAYINTLEGHPTWLVTGKEIQSFFPRIIPDNVARGFVVENGAFDPLEEAGGPDMFGVQWVYVPTVRGSMEDPEQPHLLEDVNDWREVIQFPDVDSWDWEGSAEKNKDFLNENKFVQPWIFTGWFERLISFMGFENAALALVDEDQTEAIKELMSALSDTYIDIIDHYVKYYGHINGFMIHDDWGSQQAPFFRPDIAAELFVPAMKKVTDHLHSLGMYAELHSCGNHGMQQIENIVDAGWDSWMPQTMNDIETLWQEWGDKIMLPPAHLEDPSLHTEEELIQAADEFVQKYCTTPGKTAFMNFNDLAYMVPPVRKELYIKSREAYNEWPEA